MWSYVVNEWYLEVSLQKSLCLLQAEVLPVRLYILNKDCSTYVPLTSLSYLAASSKSFVRCMLYKKFFQAIISQTALHLSVSKLYGCSGYFHSLLHRAERAGSCTISVCRDVRQRLIVTLNCTGAATAANDENRHLYIWHSQRVGHKTSTKLCISVASRLPWDSCLPACLPLKIGWIEIERLQVKCMDLSKRVSLDIDLPSGAGAHP